MDDAAPVAAGRSSFRLVKGFEDWKLGEIQILRNDDVCTSLPVDFTTIPTRCRDLGLAVPDKAGSVFGLEIQRLDALQELSGIRTRVARPEASRAKQLAKIDSFESHEPELLYSNLRFEHLLVTARVEKEFHEAQDLESPKGITDGMIELANTKRPCLCSRPGFCG